MLERQILLSKIYSFEDYCFNIDCVITPKSYTDNFDSQGYFDNIYKFSLKHITSPLQEPIGSCCVGKQPLFIVRIIRNI
jgi:hypothetical protein